MGNVLSIIPLAWNIAVANVLNITGETNVCGMFIINFQYLYKMLIYMING
jgi:hypothetical protein